MALSSSKRQQRRYYIFGSFLMCCLGASLLISALATTNWFEAECRPKGDGGGDAAGDSGNINFGLFEGYKSLGTLVTTVQKLKVVCMGDDCMFSCGTTKEYREEQMELIKSGDYVGKDWVPTHCSTSTSVAFRSPVEVASDALITTTTEEPTSSSPATPPGQEAQFLDYGLWAATIACLCLGMLFAVVGALFAVINTATTPVEAITGVPGLYVWNTLAALFNLVCVIVWAVQFHLHLTANVLVADEQNGWTTQGLEVFGYSFWLVVVAIFVHVANILIIFFGTYEPRVKEQMKAPEAKSGTIMLY